MAIEVTVPSNSSPRRLHEQAIDFGIEDGHLVLWRRGQYRDAAYAPGMWKAAKVVDQKD